MNSSSSSKGKQKVDELINLSDDEREDMMMEEDDVVQLGEDLYEEHKKEEDLEEEPGNRVPLDGCQLVRNKAPILQRPNLRALLGYYLHLMAHLVSKL